MQRTAGKEHEVDTFFLQLFLFLLLVFFRAPLLNHRLGTKGAKDSSQAGRMTRRSRSRTRSRTATRRSRRRWTRTRATRT